MPDDDPSPPGISRWKRWAMGLQVAVAVASLIAIVIMVNVYSYRHHTRFHWAPNAQHSLSPLTHQLLGVVTNDIQITVLFDPQSSSLFSEVRALLGEYDAASPKVKVEFVNFGRNPARAEFLLRQYQVGSNPESLLVIFSTPGRPPRMIGERELGEYDLSGALQGEPVRIVGFKGEQFFTSALLSLADARPLQAYALTGHGEADLDSDDDPNSYARLKALLAEKNIILHPLSLSTNSVPNDCALLVIAGPRFPIPAEERTKIDTYLRGGGRALILLLSSSRPGVRRSALEPLLAEWGVEVLEGLVIDEAQAQAGDKRLLLTGELGSHPIAAPLRGARIGLVMPAGVMAETTAPKTAAETPQVAELLTTTAQGMVVTPVGNGQGLVRTNGVIPLAVAVERGAIANVNPGPGVTRMVVVGEATFLSNQLIDFEANRDFCSLAINWLVGRQQLLELGPRPLREHQLNLTQAQLHGAAWVLVGVLPGSVLLLGLLVWMRRRR